MYQGIWVLMVQLVRMLIIFTISVTTTAHVTGPEGLLVQSSVCVSTFIKISLRNVA